MQASTTTAFARLLRKLLRDPEIGQRVVPIIPDEARTFGLDALFREVKIYAPFGQHVRAGRRGAAARRTARRRNGRILEEGITEAGAMASFTAAGTAYATWGQPMIPFFIFYSMFGFQRVGDLIWAFGDQRGRGFLLGATAGRTTLTGEGLQHCDGQSQLLASTVPNCRAYDPAFAYEVAVIVRDGIERMYGDEPEDCFYYLTLYNENYVMPPMPRGASRTASSAACTATGRRRSSASTARRSSASGTAMLAALEAQQMLAEEYDVAADVWSATSYKLLREDALERRALEPAAPDEPPRTPYVTEQLARRGGPDRRGHRLREGRARPDRAVRAAPVRAARHRRLRATPTRAPRCAATSRSTPPNIVVAVLDGLARLGDVKGEAVAEAIRRYEIDPEASRSAASPETCSAPRGEELRRPGGRPRPCAAGRPRPSRRRGRRTRRPRSRRRRRRPRGRRGCRRPR